MSDAEKEFIRGIVRETLREYTTALNAAAARNTTNTDAKNMLREIALSNRSFMGKNSPAHFAHLADGQHPRATVITCSDSRVHTHAMDATPDGDLFMVRNIGNQISTAEGSVEYGVHHLHTPLLLIVGHVACGAIKAASGDYSAESATIKRELDTIQIPKGDAGLNSVKINVNNQVRQAMNKFQQETASGSLTVVGAVYDFTNEMKLGLGKINIINVNGETNSANIARLDVMQGMNAPPPKPAVRYAPKRRAPPKAEEEEAAEPEKPAKNKEGH
jgi:carbonic anhydrase